jgi:hypothetical protein
MIKDIIETLNFFKYLYEIEIDELNTEEKVRLMDTIYSIAFQLFYDTKKISEIDRISSTDGVWDECYELGLREIQAWFKDKFVEIMTTINKKYEWEAEGWRTEEEIADGILAFPIIGPLDINLLPGNLIIENVRISAKIVVKVEYKTEDGKVYVRRDPEWRKNSRIRVGASINPKLGLLAGFLRVINGSPPDTFRHCAACDKWYFHLSKRERKYCSEKCTKKMQARKRRERDRQKITKKSNDRKTKAKSGIDLKTNQRPRKR